MYVIFWGDICFTYQFLEDQKLKQERSCEFRKKISDLSDLTHDVRSYPVLRYIHTGQNQWFSGKAARKYDSLFLETQEWYGWIRTAFVILYKLEWKW
jgi:hypothetical protein